MGRLERYPYLLRCDYFGISTESTMYTVALAVGTFPQTTFEALLTLYETPEPEVVRLLFSRVG